MYSLEGELNSKPVCHPGNCSTLLTAMLRIQINRFRYSQGAVDWVPGISLTSALLVTERLVTIELYFQKELIA